MTICNPALTFALRSLTSKESSMYDAELLVRDRQKTLLREAREHRLAMVARRTRHAANGMAPRSPYRRTRIRIGELLISTGLAIAGTADDHPAHLGRPA